MAAIALALRLFDLDHGHRPGALSDLVPDYLPAVPPDPFAANEGPINYRPGDDPPVLYSVYVNGVDDQGAYDLGSSGGIARDTRDLPFFLGGNRPKVESSD